MDTGRTDLEWLRLAGFGTELNGDSVLAIKKYSIMTCFAAIGLQTCETLPGSSASLSRLCLCLMMLWMQFNMRVTP